MRRPMDDARRCRARSTQTGERCRKAAMLGQRVCRSHGGASPQAQRGARRRLDVAADPAAAKLVKMLDDADPAIRSRVAIAILDRSGHHPRSDDGGLSAEEALRFVRTITGVFLEVVEDAQLRRAFALALRRKLGSMGEEVDVPAMPSPALPPPAPPEPEELWL